MKKNTLFLLKSFQALNSYYYISLIIFKIENHQAYYGFFNILNHT